VTAQRERYIFFERRLKDDPTTLEGLSQHYGISRERMRKSKARGLQKLWISTKGREVYAAVRGGKLLSCTEIAMYSDTHLREEKQIVMLQQALRNADGVCYQRRSFPIKTTSATRRIVLADSATSFGPFHVLPCISAPRRTLRDGGGDATATSLPWGDGSTGSLPLSCDRET
jgi:hypothetical protein